MTWIAFTLYMLMMGWFPGTMDAAVSTGDSSTYYDEVSATEGGSGVPPGALEGGSGVPPGRI